MQEELKQMLTTLSKLITRATEWTVLISVDLRTKEAIFSALAQPVPRVFVNSYHFFNHKLSISQDIVQANEWCFKTADKALRNLQFKPQISIDIYRKI